MGRGDKRTFRGKIYAGSYGNTRPQKGQKEGCREDGRRCTDEGPCGALSGQRDALPPLRAVRAAPEPRAFRARPDHCVPPCLRSASTATTDTRT